MSSPSSTPSPKQSQSPPSTSSSANDSWATLALKTVGGVVSVAAVVGVPLLYLNYRSWQQQQEQKRLRKRSRTSRPRPPPSPSSSSSSSTSLTSTSSSSSSPRSPTNEHTLRQSLITSMNTIETRMDVEGKVEKTLLEILTKSSLHPSDYSLETRIMAAQWLLLYQDVWTLKQSKMHGTSPDILTSLHTRFASHLHRVFQWLFLADITQPSSHAMQQHVQQEFWSVILDWGQRSSFSSSHDMPQLQYISTIIDEIMSILTSTTSTTSPPPPHIILSLFRMCLHLGRWSDAVILGTRVIAHEGSLVTYHDDALQQPTRALDLLVLYDTAKAAVTEAEDLDAINKDENYDAGHEVIPKPILVTTPLTSLAWTWYEVVMLKSVLQDVMMDDPDSERGLRDNLQKQEAEKKVEWISLPAGMRRLHRQGAIIQGISVFSARITMAGRADDTKIRMRGFVSVPSESGLVHTRSEERLELTRIMHDPIKGKSEWHGTLVFKRETIGVQTLKAGDSATVRYQLSLRMLEPPSSSSSSSSSGVASSSS